MDTPKFKRVLLKISGEALAGDKKIGLDFDVVDSVAKAIKECVALGVQIGVVVGGGNFWRGVKDGGGRMERTRADHMGMLATAINALALADVLENNDVVVRVQTGIDMNKIAEPYIRLKAISHLEKGRVVIFAAGTGNPFFTTDTAAALRASEINAEALLMAKNGVDGVYTDDPRTNPNAKKLEKITYDDIIKNGLKVMDTSACALCKQNNIPIVVFDFDAQNGICKILNSEEIGTYISL